MMGRYIPVITYHCGWYYLSSNAGAYSTYAEANQARIEWMNRRISNDYNHIPNR